MIYIGIVGSRRRSSEEDYNILYKKVCELERNEPIEKFVTGDCRVGGDAFCRTIALYWGRNLEVKYKIDPETDDILHRFIKDYYKFTQICYMRNEEIAKESLDYLIALIAPDRKGGTENTIKHFKRYHKDWKKKLILI